MYGYDDEQRPASTAPKRLADLRPPDCCPSFSIFDIGTVRQDLVQVLEIKADDGLRLGALVIRVIGDPDTGKLGAHGVSIFTHEEIQGYGKEKSG